ncbi:MAG: hypothetical protein FD149_564 [Rhodospirillaceae bacterium]|nr:MAG: hypothetical protein FD149_564 [Rhodospirillaceae bacterium]
MNKIRLPKSDEEAAKFVLQAVLAQPEIYFASLVILGEGDSEEVVVPRVAKALGIDLDPLFIAFAPLGGRHVNHFWRLLKDLDIPFLTLLDFDLGRHGAGPLRLKYAYDQLKKIEAIDPSEWVEGNPATIDSFKDLSEVKIRSWRESLAKHCVFYSYPLDLDMMMLRAFPKAYGVDDANVPKNTSTLKTSVFGRGPGLEAYEEKVLENDCPTIEELAAYDTLFKKRGKPGSHLKALAEITDEAIQSNCPVPLRALIEAADRILRARSEQDTAED